MAAWYGPLIDLSEAASHIGNFVQLLVFVHRSTSVQYKLPKGGEVVRTDIQVGDDTRRFFSVTLWKKEMRSMVVSGDVILLQNVKIARFQEVVQARTVEWSSLLRLVHPYESLFSKGAAQLVAECKVGIVTKEKLAKVIEWVQQSRSIFPNVKPAGYKQKRQLSRNWKVPDQNNLKACSSLSEVLHITNYCEATLTASVGEIFLPITWRSVDESEHETMFISRRINSLVDNNLAEDLICTGCQICGLPLGSEHGKALTEQKSVPFYCEKSANRLHVVNLIYRPFMLYVWDESEHLPLLVRNNAAEKLFGNIKAETVYVCYKRNNCNKKAVLEYLGKEDHHEAGATNHLRDTGKDVGCCSSDACKRRGSRKNQQCNRNTNFYLVWLILLKMLLQQEKNSPLKFEIAVNASRDTESGRFEMISFSLPCFNAF